MNETNIDREEFIKIAKDLKEKNYHLVAMIAEEESKELFLRYYFYLKEEELMYVTKLDKNHPHMDSIVEMYPTAMSYEREIKDLFGVWFNGNEFMKEKFFLPEDGKIVTPLRRNK